ncbi:M28 family peptidase [Silvibacterium sp.]|uniref:M28 family peptidase n=1 Tax=Silvibacterium sp. TaxID=1964179 RepID=UPI0039E4A9D5
MMKLRSVMAAMGLALAAGVMPAHAQTQDIFNGQKALDYTRQFVAIGPRFNGSPGHAKAEAFLKKQFAHDQLEEDTFTANTAVGPQTMHNYIVRFPGKKKGVIVLATHYETNWPLRNINFVGANDGGATTGLLIELANYLRGHEQDGYSVWLVFFDGEEAVKSWTAEDSLYGSKHLSEKWQKDGTLPQIKAFLLADMIGDKDLDICRDKNSTPWVLDVVEKAAEHFGYQSYFFQQESMIEDDHLPFVQKGVPVADVIDLDYGYENAYHHTVEDTMDKLSAKSLTISGDVFLETIHLLDQR